MRARTPDGTDFIESRLAATKAPRITRQIVRKNAGGTCFQDVSRSIAASPPARRRAKSVGIEIGVIVATASAAIPPQEAQDFRSGRGLVPERSEHGARHARTSFLVDAPDGHARVFGLD